MVQTLPAQSLRIYNSGRMTGRADFMNGYLPGGRYCIGICRETRQESVRKKIRLIWDYQRMISTSRPVSIPSLSAGTRSTPLLFASVFKRPDFPKSGVAIPSFTETRI